ncbi:MAG: L-glyceraldehyde 3-phosphate reductase [Alphaproteobacteria bacterium MarineAlpha3_Bin5]|nr:aldo/keto reductase [Magnetovibrio sp.]PPR76749.1 MAG: L-glyceraldehyde 3-phosphate reductase [Alphaproteobacteria bacterium MarineAlpha3_Bin5]|tara:strand:+ start:2049 stop:3014 length:966 start_codon:yes stop_codon:yes gene_type:complete
MEYVRFGKSNLKVSKLSFGAMGFGSKKWREWVLNRSESRPIIKKALDSGINFFDTCDFYSIGESEKILGKILLDCVPRDEVIIATKVGNPMGSYPNAGGFSRKHIFDAVDASLKRLNTEYIDLYQTHIWQPDTELEELVDSFGDLVKSGKVRYLGVTTLPSWTFSKLIQNAERKSSSPFISMQCEYNLCHREAERELIPLCRAEGIALIPFSPLARGFLCADRRSHKKKTLRTKSDSYTHQYYYRDSDFLVFEAVKAIADRRNLNAAQISLAWVLQQSGVTSPIFGATKIKHIEDAVKALSVHFDDSERAALEAAYESRFP